MDKTTLGDRMKMYEKKYSRRSMPLLPVIARLDGRAFHTWTKGLDLPFDDDFMSVMQTTTQKLVKETGATIGYTQSDEITLIFYSPDPESQIFFDGKLEKMISVLASMCTAQFSLSLQRQIWKHGGPMALNGQSPKAELLFQKPPAIFDCRVFQVPTKEEAVNCLIWRELDATRNSILAVAQSKFSNREMHGKKTPELQEMMFQKDGTNWGEDYTPAQKRGSYFRRIKHTRKFTSEELDKLPPKHLARENPDLVVERTDIERVVLPILTKVTNRVECIFDSAVPTTEQEESC